MKHIGLFEGIGGFSLASRWMGWETIAWCEWNPFGQRVLNYHFPKAKGHGDIKQTDFTIYRGQCDILTGGFPCQPYSQAGKRLGKEDDRHLWPEMLRSIREIQPSWIVGENVRGLTNWNGGVVFDEVQADLENEGYEVTPFLLPACAVNAPHRRDRIWFIAYSDSFCNRRESIKSSITHKQGGSCKTNTSIRIKREQQFICNFKDTGTFTDTTSSINKKGLQSRKRETYPTFGNTNDISNWERWPTQSPICSGDDGISYGLDGITFPKWRNESIKAYGNAIVPQVAFQIFKAIDQYEKEIA